MDFLKNAIIKEMGTCNGKKWVINDLFEDFHSNYKYNGMTDEVKKLYGRCKKITYHGCISGTVSSMIYYDDTVKFYDNFIDDINDYLEEVGYEWIDEAMKASDFIKCEKTAKNQIAWAFYEEVIYEVSEWLEDKLGAYEDRLF